MSPRVQMVSLHTPARKIINYFILFFFTLAFSLQQLLALTCFTIPASGQKAGYTQQSATHASQDHLSATMPAPSSTASVDMEVTEDEDDLGNEKDVLTCFLQKNTAEGLSYEGVLRIRYLQLAFSVHKQTAVPFFILHHSWKSFLV